VLKGGSIVDGTGAPPRPATVVVTNGRVEAVLGPTVAPPAGDVVEVGGRVVAPGFIDVHNHAHDEMEGGILHIPYADNMLRQGVTTIVAGNCGGSPWPIGDHLTKAKALHLATNYALLVGHGTLRQRARQAGLDLHTRDGLVHMGRELVQALDEGAVGMSSGQANASQQDLPTAEVVALAKVLAKRNRVYTVHMRDEGDGVFDAVREAVTVAEKSGARVEVSHLKVIGQKNWGRGGELLALVDEAADRKLPVGADAYPYAACYGGIWAMAIPHWERQGDKVTEATRTAIRDRVAALGGPERIRVARASERVPYVGHTLAELAATTELEPADLVIDMALHGSASCIGFLMDEPDVAAIVSHPETAIISDGQVRLLGRGISHPRNYGTFPRVLAKYVREEKRLTLELAVRKMTSLPAQRFGFADRGVIREGAVADLVVFDPSTIRDTATFEKPFQYPVGIEHILIGGRWAMRSGKVAPEGVGQVITL
jgi:N-acyl-D-aspartate/D-glutamate deacylase